MSPHPELSERYWEGARRGVLVVQKCTDCGTSRHYPRAMCARCFSFSTDHVEHDGRGTVHSWTVAHHPFHPAFADDVPYVLVTVDLEEGVRAMGRFEGAGPLTIGQPVTAVFSKNPNGVPLLVFCAIGAA